MAGIGYTPLPDGVLLDGEQPAPGAAPGIGYAPLPGDVRLDGAPAAPAPARPAGIPSLDRLFPGIDMAPVERGEANLRRLGEDAVRSVASGATFGLADEGQAALDTLTRGGTYDENVAAQRARDREISPFVRIPGEIAGGLATGTGLSRAGLTLLNVARPTVANMALRGAAEGAGYGAAYGFGNGEGTEDSLKGALVGGGLGLATGGLTGAVAGKMAQSAASKAIPSTGDLKAQANAAYKAAADAGLVVKPASFGGAVDDIAAAARDAGIDRTIHPKATAALARLQEAKDGGADLTLQNIDTLRRVIGAAAKSNEPDERRIASLMIDKLDDYVGGLSAKDVSAGDAEAGTAALATARDLWSRFRKGDVIDELVQRATDRASQFSGSGLENALRTEFRNLALNPKRMRGFSPEERDAIRRVGQGGPVENALRMVGKFAPTGVISTILSGGAGNAVGGPVGAVALPAAGYAARQAATALTRGNVRAASELVRAGGALPAAPLSPRAQGILQSLLIGEAQAPPNLLDALRLGGVPAGPGTTSR